MSVDWQTLVAGLAVLSTVVVSIGGHIASGRREARRDAAELERGARQREHELALAQARYGQEQQTQRMTWAREDEKERLRQRSDAYHRMLALAKEIRARSNDPAWRDQRARQWRELQAHVELVASSDVRWAFERYRSIRSEWFEQLERSGQPPGPDEELAEREDAAYDALVSAARTCLATNEPPDRPIASRAVISASSRNEQGGGA